MRKINRCAQSLKLGFILGVTFLVCAGLRAQNKDFSKVEIKVTKVSGNIYMLEGEGGNIAASVGEDGIVIVDDQYAPLAEKIQATLDHFLSDSASSDLSAADTEKLIVSNPGPTPLP